MSTSSIHGQVRPPVGEDDRASELLERAASGDLEAFSGYYEVVIPRVFGVVRSVVRDAALSEEVATNVMVELWRTAPRWDRANGSGMAFAVLIAHRRAIDCVRSVEECRAREVHAAAETMAPGACDDPAAPVCDAVDHQTLDAVARLPAALRDPIFLAFFGGLTHREITSGTGQPLETVKARICSGLARLRSELQPFPVADAGADGIL